MAEPKVRFKRDDGDSYPAWHDKSLGEVLTISSEKNGAKYSKDDVLSVSDEYGVVNQIAFQGRSFAGENISGYKVVHDGQIIYTRSPLLAKPFGIIKIVHGITGIVSPLYVVNDVTLENDPQFVYYMFDSPERTNNYLKPLVRVAPKHTMNISNEEWLSGRVYMPCYDEQLKIADFLSNVDEVISTSEQEVANLETQKKAVMKRIFLQEVRFKKDDGTEFPEWEERTFDELAEYKKGPFGSALKKEIFVPKGAGTVKVYEQQNAIGKDWKLERYFIAAEYGKKMKAFEVHAGDIIISCAGTIGEIYELPSEAERGVINQALMRVRVNEDITLKYFFSCVFDMMISSEGSRISNGSALKNIPPFADMKKQAVFIPCLEEQRLIADFLSDFDEAIAAAKKELELWKELKKGLLQQMFV